MMASLPVQKQLDLGADVEEGSVNSNIDESVHSGHEDSTDSRHTGTGTSSRGPGKDGSTSEEKLNWAKTETTAVFRLRLLVFGVLFLAAIAVSLIVYLITAKGEHQEYQTQYHGAAKKIQEEFISIVNDRLSSISALGVAMTAHGRDHAKSWPWVTLSSFQERASTALEQSGVLYVHVNPRVQADQREEWEIFSATSEDAKWIDNGMAFQTSVGKDFVHNAPSPRAHYNRTAPWPIWYYDAENEQFPDDSEGEVFPTWQSAPIVYMGGETNENILANKDGLNSGAKITFDTDSVSISQLIQAPAGTIHSDFAPTAYFALMVSAKAGVFTRYEGDPISRVYFPVFNNFTTEREPVAIMQSAMRWNDFFTGVLPDSQGAVHIVLKDSCGGEYTYAIEGEISRPLGEGDLHDPKYTDMKETVDFSTVKNIADGSKFGLPFNQDFCPFSLDIYPTEAFYKQYNTNTPIVMTVAVSLVFCFAVIMFICYDRLVERRQKLVMIKAQQTNAIVASLFPENVRDRLMEQAAQQAEKKAQRASATGKSGFVAPNERLKGYLDGQEEDEIDHNPIADLFPHCTVLFSDIAGFTAWSSTRDPAQVFILLQTVYQAFDKIAKRRKVFKVETIGDSYVAVTGLPEPQKAHHVIMARFAGECKLKFNELTARLENTLGPDTGDLSMRFGLHSGPVTAGVLQGERARFQLFGDTVNTAARMESTGVRDKIQISESTYKLLVESGKMSWIKPRADVVVAKGKGNMKTYWLDPKSRGGSSSNGDAPSSAGESASDAASSAMTKDLQLPTSASSLRVKKTAEADQKQERLVNWIVDMLHDHIRKVVALRPERSRSKSFTGTVQPKVGQTSLDEVAEVIILPRFCEKNFQTAQKSEDIKVGSVVLEQLKDYVSTVANMYRNNPFHNFEHACHVSMATNKFLKRIVAPDIAFEKEQIGDIASQLHNYTHGINSDPLTLLAIVFSALIHDADHRGVSNPQLGTENPDLAEKYHNKSLAEQHSLDQCWALLMEDRFIEMRNCIFRTEDEVKRFRQVLVNVVLATDIFDKELNDLRKKRWGKAFSSENLSDEENNDLRATIVIEHIIQASDVSHTMQHWHIYRKWNKRLFTEMYIAYKEGRMAKDPSEFWYRGEIGFFDNYVIPLAKKLKDCNVFGVSSDECLNYAMLNRNEWEDKGAQIVEEMKAELAFQEGLAIPETTTLGGDTDAESGSDSSA